MVISDSRAHRHAAHQPAGRLTVSASRTKGPFRLLPISNYGTSHPTQKGGEGTGARPGPVFRADRTQGVVYALTRTSASLFIPSAVDRRPGSLRRRGGACAADRWCGPGGPSTSWAGAGRGLGCGGVSEGELLTGDGVTPRPDELGQAPCPPRTSGAPPPFCATLSKSRACHRWRPIPARRSRCRTRLYGGLPARHRTLRR